MQAPSWLADIQLVTFDCFGTLIDWRAGMATVELDGDADFAAFLDACRELERADRAGPWASVVKDALRRLRPSLRPAVVGLFADDLGRLPPFADAPGALASLQTMARVGVWANSDANHQLDVTSTLRLAWDVVITSADVRASKPSDRAWDAAVRSGVARTAVPRDAWLHVSAFGRTDLEPARARGLRTCHVRRTGGDAKASADLAVDDLAQLAAAMAEAKRGPLVRETEWQLPDQGTRDVLRAFWVRTLLPALRATAGLREARLLEYEDGRLVEHLVFGGARELDAYEEAFAAEHRAMFAEAGARHAPRQQRRVALAGRSQA